MDRKALQIVLVLGLFLSILSFGSCSQVYVKVLPTVPTVYETIRVYGIAPWTGEKSPAQLKHVESASKLDAQAITATLARGMKFNYRFKDKGDVTVDSYTQSTWANLHNFAVKYRDFVDADKSKYLLSTADVSLVYDIDEENYKEMKKGIGVETRVSLKPDQLLSMNQVVSMAVQQAVKKLYGDRQKDVEGSVWVIKVLPEFNVSGTLLKEETNRYLTSKGKYVPQNSNSMGFLVTLVIRKDYIPSNAYSAGNSTSLTEVVGVINTNEEGAFVLPSFALEEPEDREKAKEKAKKRAENFADYISRGFEYKGEVFSPRKDRERAKITSYSYSTQAMIGGDTRQIIIGKGIVKPEPFKKPLVQPTKIELKQTFLLNDKNMLEKVLDNLPSLLVVKAIKTYGSKEGLGYFGNTFYWRAFQNEKTGQIELEISCEVYMHIKVFDKKY